MYPDGTGRVTKWHNHEALDRTSNIMDIIDMQLYDHPAITEKDRVLLDAALEKLGKLYQRLGVRNAKKEKHTKR